MQNTPSDNGINCQSLNNRYIKPLLYFMRTHFLAALVVIGWVYKS